MTLQQIINLARTLTYTTSDQVPDGDINSGCVLYGNLIYKDIVNSIQQFVDEEFYIEKFTGDIVANQNRYALPQTAGSTPGMRKISSLELDLTGDGLKATKPTSIGQISLDGYSIDSYGNYITETAPKYLIKDKEIIVFPTPAVDVEGGIVFYGKKEVLDIALADTPDLQEEYHQLIAIGMKQYIFAQKGLWQEKENATQEYYREKQNLLTQVDDRISNPVEKTLPSLTRYE